MTERDGSGYGDEGGQRPSGRGAVTERLARRDQGAREIDLTDEAAKAEAGDDTVVSPAARPDGDQADRESSGAFEPAEPVVPATDPPAEAGRRGSSIFDVDERAKQEELNRTGYEPPVADTADPDGSRGETTVTEPGEPRPEPADAEAGDATATPVADPPAEAGDATATPVADPPAEADAPAATGTPADADAATGTAAPSAPAAAEAPEALLGSLDTAGIRSRFLDIQAGFIDEPRQAVEEAGRFVDDLVRQVADALQQQRGRLADASDDASTEDLRLTLRAYRQFVDRLLGLGG
jgi:hypothetical protein